MDEKEQNSEYKLRGVKISCPRQGDCYVCENRGAQKFSTYDWLEGVKTVEPCDIFEIQFKNTRKGFYRNVNNLSLQKGDIVAVEASPGHDLGIVSLCGDLVRRQMKRKNIDETRYEIKKIYRKARAADVEKWQEAIALEHSTMIKSRQIAASLGLNMKIGDVEYQGDKTKAIFYYIADERVDFRELIKVLAEQFHIRIEMRQIGARQEAGLIGGIGPCGRELCCAQWLGNFVSVTTGTARFQELSPNPQKLAGQCCKLKCCLNYEYDIYADARKDFPRINSPLELVDGKQAFLIKTDVLKRLMYFSYVAQEGASATIAALPVERVKALLAMNKKGIKIEKLEEEKVDETVDETADFKDAVGDESITRFDKSKKNNKRRKFNKNNKNNGEQNHAEAAAPNQIQSQNQRQNVQNQNVNPNRNVNQKQNNNQQRQNNKNANPKASNQNAGQQRKNVQNQNVKRQNNQNQNRRQNGQNRNQGSDNNQQKAKTDKDSAANKNSNNA